MKYPIIYYEPSIFPQIIDALKPGGMFILEQFSIDHLKYRETSRFGPRNPDYLLTYSHTLKGVGVCQYEDTVVELDEGMHKGTAAVIRLIAEKAE